MKFICVNAYLLSCDIFRILFMIFLQFFFFHTSVVCRLWFVPNFGPVDESEPCRRYVPKNNKYFCNKFFNLVRLIAKWCFLRHFAPLESRHRCTASCSIFLYMWMYDCGVCPSEWQYCCTNFSCVLTLFIFFLVFLCVFSCTFFFLYWLVCVKLPHFLGGHWE